MGAQHCADLRILEAKLIDKIAIHRADAASRAEKSALAIQRLAAEETVEAKKPSQLPFPLETE
jgi:hypothetical protein